MLVNKKKGWATRPPIVNETLWVVFAAFCLRRFLKVLARNWITEFEKDLVFEGSAYVPVTSKNNCRYKFVSWLSEQRAFLVIVAGLGPTSPDLCTVLPTTNLILCRSKNKKKQL